MMNRLNDLLFVIGLFLTLIGSLVLIAAFTGPSDLVHGVRVNLTGGGAILFVGLCMIVRSLFTTPASFDKK